MDPKVSSDWLYCFQGWNASAARKASIALQRHGDWSHHCGFAPTSEIRLSNHNTHHTHDSLPLPWSAIRHMGFPTGCAAGAGERKIRSSCARDGIFDFGHGLDVDGPELGTLCPRPGCGGRDCVFCIPFKGGRKKLMLLLLLLE
jgi:hypothetical protein